MARATFEEWRFLVLGLDSGLEISKKLSLKTQKAGLSTGFSCFWTFLRLILGKILAENGKFL